YYSIPVRPIYKAYAWYSPDRQPDAYPEWLRQQEPEVIWGVDNHGQDHKPPLATEADWIQAGKLVFEAPVGFSPPVPDGFFKNRPRFDLAATKDGVMPFASLVIREKGKVQVGISACAQCHTRVMPDGTVIQGAQGNFPDDQVAFQAASV